MQVSLLLQEGMTMYGLSHKNILSVLGVSIEDHTAPFLIYPHQGYTNLKRYGRGACTPNQQHVSYLITISAYFYNLLLVRYSYSAK